jgi:hypothetical protein
MGNNVPQDINQALYWYRLAAQNGNAWAKNNMDRLASGSAPQQQTADATIANGTVPQAQTSYWGKQMSMEQSHPPENANNRPPVAKTGFSNRDSIGALWGNAPSSKKNFALSESDKDAFMCHSYTEVVVSQPTTVENMTYMGRSSGTNSRLFDELQHLEHKEQKQEMEKLKKEFEVVAQREWDSHPNDFFNVLEYCIDKYPG